MDPLYPSQSRPDCPTTVQSRRKYVFTDQIDQLIREIYLTARTAKTRSGIRLLAKKVDIPRWALKKRRMPR